MNALEKIRNLENGIRRRLNEILDDHVEDVVENFLYSIFTNVFDHIFTETTDNDIVRDDIRDLLYDDMYDYVRTQHLDDLFTVLEHSFFHRVLNHDSIDKKTLNSILTSVLRYDIDACRGDSFYNAIQHVRAQVIQHIE